MKKRKALRKEIKRLSRRIAKLESISTVNSFYYGSELTFPEYVRKAEEIICNTAQNTSEHRSALEKQIALIEEASSLSIKAHRYDELTRLTSSLISLYLALHSK